MAFKDVEPTVFPVKSCPTGSTADGGRAKSWEQFSREDLEMITENYAQQILAHTTKMEALKDSACQFARERDKARRDLNRLRKTFKSFIKSKIL